MYVLFAADAFFVCMLLLVAICILQNIFILHFLNDYLPSVMNFILKRETYMTVISWFLTSLHSTPDGKGIRRCSLQSKLCNIFYGTKILFEMSKSNTNYNCFSLLS